MRLNTSKCEYLCIFNKRAPIQHSYYLNNYLPKSVSSVKYLGVIVDAKLSWNKHMSIMLRQKLPEHYTYIVIRMYFM